MAIQNPLLQQIDAIAKEKGVEPEIIIGAIQDAIEAAARKRYKNETLRARFNNESGQLELCAVKRIVEEVTDPPNQISLTEAQQLYGDEAEVDMEIEFPRPTEDLGRIAAQTAKQVIFQKVREAERENVYAEYSNRVGDVVNGVVKRFENGDIIMELGRIEAQLPRKEQSRAENYAVGDRVRAVIRGVNRSAKGPQIVLSRTDPALLIKLFEQEVPEIYDGTVVIRGAVREADDDRAVVDFRDFLLEQLDEQRRIRAREDDLRSLRAAIDAADDGADPIADGIVLRPRLFLPRELRFDAAQLHDDVAVLEPLHDTVDDVADAV